MATYGGTEDDAATRARIAAVGRSARGNGLDEGQARLLAAFSQQTEMQLNPAREDL